MALTREIEQHLERAGLIAPFTNKHAAWKANCQDAYGYTKKAFDGQKMRHDASHA